MHLPYLHVASGDGSQIYVPVDPRSVVAIFTLVQRTQTPTEGMYVLVRTDGQEGVAARYRAFDLLGPSTNGGSLFNQLGNDFTEAILDVPSEDGFPHGRDARVLPFAASSVRVSNRLGVRGREETEWVFQLAGRHYLFEDKVVFRVPHRPSDDLLTAVLGTF